MTLLQSIFRLFIFTALLGVYLFLLKTWSADEVVLLGIFFFALYSWRDWLYKDYDAFSDFQLERLRKERPTHYVFGEIFESGEAENRERMLFENAALRKKRNQSAFGYWLVVGIIMCVVVYGEGLHVIRGRILFIIFLMSFIPRSSHVVIQLSSLFIGTLAALFALWTQEQTNLAAGFLFILGTFGAFISFQTIRMKHNSNSERDFEWAKSTLIKTSSAVCGFLILLYLSFLFFPESKEKTLSKRPEIFSKVQDRVLTEVAKTIAQIESSKAVGHFGLNNSLNRKESSSELRPQENLSRLPVEIASIERMHEVLKNLNPQQLEELQKAVASSKTSDEALTSLQRQGIKSDDQAVLKELLQQPGDLEKLAKALEANQVELESRNNLLARKENASEGEYDKGPMLKRGERGAPEVLNEQPVGDQPAMGKTSLEKSPANSNIKIDQAEQLEKRQNEIKNELEFHFDKLVITFKLIVAGITAFFLIRFILRKQNRENTKKIRRLTNEEIKGFKDDLRRIRQLKLSPDQEVIETYNVMLKVFDLIELGRKDSEPAQMFISQVSLKLPGLKKPLSAATLTFENTLYGENMPKPQTVKEFRQSAKTVFRGFNIDFKI